VWTRDSRRVTFVSSPTGTGSLYLAVQRWDGSAPADTLLASHTPIEEIEWMPDGRRFLYRTGSTAGLRDIWLGTVGDTVGRLLVGGPADEFAPAASPDGKWFAYVSNESGRNEVYVRSIEDPGAGRTQISTAGGQEPRWATSGKELFYRTRSGEMMTAEVTLGASFVAKPPRRLFVAPNLISDEFHHAYDVTRDGRFLMVSPVGEEDRHLVLILNWFNEMKGRK